MTRTSQLQKRRLLILATTSQKHVLRDMGMLDAFNAHLNVPVMTTVEHIENVLEVCGASTLVVDMCVPVMLALMLL